MTRSLCFSSAVIAAGTPRRRSLPLRYSSSARASSSPMGASDRRRRIARAQRHPCAHVVCRGELLADRVYLRLRTGFPGPAGGGRNLDRILHRNRDVRCAAHLPVSRADLAAGRTSKGEGRIGGGSSVLCRLIWTHRRSLAIEGPWWSS